MTRFFKSAVPFLILLILLLPAIWSLFRPGFFISDDGEWMIIRLTAFHQALAAGSFPIRFALRLNHGYGYPVFNFAYPGGFYLAESFHLLGASFVDSIKLVFGFAVILAGFFSFLWLRTRFSLTASALGSLFYVYSPYFLWDIYKRGSMGEILALAIIPLILWVAETKSIGLFSLGLGLLIISHNILALLFLPIIFLYVIFKKIFTIYYLLLTTFLGLSLSAFFWLPAIYESRLTVLSKTVVGNPLENFVSDLSLFGVLNLIVFFLAFLLFLKKRDKIVGLFLSVFLLSLFFASPISAFFWRVFPWSFLFQFPFRFLSLTLPGVAFLVAFVFNESFRQKRILWLTAGLFILFYFSLPFTKPVGFFQKEEGFYLTNEHSTTIHDEYMPIWVKVKPEGRPKEKIEVVEGQAKIEVLKNTGRQIEFKTSSTIPSIIRVNTLYYPGWQVLLDGVRSKFSYQNNKGVIEIPIKEGEHKVLVEFRETPFRAFSDIISLISVTLLVFIGLHELTRICRAKPKKTLMA